MTHPRHSPAVAACLDEWKKGWTPSQWSQQYFRREFRQTLEAAMAWLFERLEAGDELQAADIAQRFADHVQRLDTELRRHLAGDRHPDGGSGPVVIGRNPF